MREQLIALNELQTVDSAILEIEKSREAIPRRLEEICQRLDLSRAEIDGLRNEVIPKSDECQLLEATLVEEKAKLKKWEARLTEMRNPRDYQALSREIEIAKRQNSEMEEQILTLSISIEEINKTISEKTSIFTEMASHAAAEETTLREKMSVLDTRLAEDYARRKEKVAKLPESIVRRYDAIRARRFGKALARVADGICLACNMNIPPQLYIELQRLESFHSCPSCYRILFWEGILEDQDEEGEQVERRAKQHAG